MTTNLPAYLPATIEKLALKAQTTEILSDGTKTLTYKGFVSSETAHLIYLIAEAERHCTHYVVFSNSGDDYSWSVKQNFVPKGNSFYIQLVLNDYTNVAKSIAQSNNSVYRLNISVLVKRFEEAQRYFNWVVSNPQNWHDFLMAIDGASELLMERAQAIADYEMYAESTLA